MSEQAVSGDAPSRGGRLPAGNGDASWRRHVTGAESARRLLQTVLGELLLPVGGSAWTSAFIEVMQRWGVEPGTTRQALARMAGAGWLQAERIGRQTRWCLTSRGATDLAAAKKRVWEFANRVDSWDGRWLVVMASVPESDRSMRHFMRTRLGWAGLGSPAPGVWVGTQTERLRDVQEVLTQSRVADTAQIFVAEHMGSADQVQAMVSEAWDLRAIEADYDDFLSKFSLSQASDELQRTLELVHAWRPFPWRDPALPKQLLPPTWRANEAATLFRAKHGQWWQAACDQWCELNSQGSPRG